MVTIGQIRFSQTSRLDQVRKNHCDQNNSDLFSVFLLSLLDWCIKGLFTSLNPINKINTAQLYQLIFIEIYNSDTGSISISQ